MVAITFSHPPSCIEKILQITVQHFEVSPLLDAQLALLHGEFRDLPPFRWTDTKPFICPSPSEPFIAYS
jgi:hypothetical protein